MDFLDELVASGLIRFEEQQRLRELGQLWNVPAYTLARTMRLVECRAWLEAYARFFQVEVAEVESLSWHEEMAARVPLVEWAKALALPVRDKEGKAAIAAVDPAGMPKMFKDLCPRWLVMAEEDWTPTLVRMHGAVMLDEAVNGLARRLPEVSARQTFTRTQVGVMWTGGSLYLAWLWFYPGAALLGLIGAINIFFFICVAFKTFLVLFGASRSTASKVSPEEVAAVRDSDLPIYTVLVPVYKEPSVIPNLVKHLAHLDYPLAKLDVQVLLEQDDPATREAFLASNPPPNFHAVVVPTAQPKTKPKACNFGLQIARGEFLTIYDAEDLPESDQLKKVILAFRKLPASTMCIQAALNYFNWRENLLTRMFTLEYSNWFDYNLPGMEALGVPIPLGGTSNHFRCDRLRELCGWDPFNVTEDADLGIRATALGYTVSTIDSTTYEEANRAYGNWIRQRSRWIKGYMQTFLVHMRNPMRMIRKVGLKAFLGFVFFIGGTPFIFLTNPILWVLFLLWLVTGTAFMSALLPPWLLYLSFANLLAGNFLAVYVCIIGVFRRRNFPMSIYAFVNPLYWMMHAVASYKGLYQLLVKPFYWEKTEHGLTNVKAKMPGRAS